MSPQEKALLDLIEARDGQAKYKDLVIKDMEHDAIIGKTTKSRLIKCTKQSAKVRHDLSEAKKKDWQQIANEIWAANKKKNKIEVARAIRQRLDKRRRREELERAKKKVNNDAKLIGGKSPQYEQAMENILESVNDVLEKQSAPDRLPSIHTIRLKIVNPYKK